MEPSHRREYKTGIKALLDVNESASGRGTSGAIVNMISLKTEPTSLPQTKLSASQATLLQLVA
jgi:hypothetical protein